MTVLQRSEAEGPEEALSVVLICIQYIIGLIMKLIKAKEEHEKVGGRKERERERGKIKTTRVTA